MAEASEKIATRTSEQGNTFEVPAIRAFLARTLADDLLADEVNELLFAHVVERRYHPSVIAETLPQIINEILYTATREDWQALADQLIGEARELEDGRG